MTGNKTKHMVLCGFGLAIVFVFTAFVSIPIGQFGYVNMGDSTTMLFATILSPTVSFFTGGVGSALADLYLGYSQYAIFTLIAKGGEALIVSLFFRYFKNKISYFGFLVGGIYMIFTYYLADALLYGDMIVAIGGVGFNFMQAMVSIVIAVLLEPLFIKLNKKYFLD